jgi:hypothetical protein
MALAIALAVIAFGVAVIGGVEIGSRRQHERRHARLVAHIAQLEQELNIGGYAEHIDRHALLALKRRRREALKELALVRDEAVRPGPGKALKLRRSGVKPTVENYLVATEGPLPYMRRLREIDELTQEHLESLEDRWWSLAAEQDDPDAFEAQWRETVASWPFAKLNELIAEHNRCYPLEAHLGMDPATRGYRLVDGHSYERSKLDAAWVFERFPADLLAARRSLGG